ncbi:MAG: hypothetical protein EO766_12210 [Hydrotalea sp. AMD]|uniref:hypothetical protein n=1 Tax=Hydrotalea sp. AMD TaxID=2501297 RepID=UPI00102869F3|nr:hypothetical protein [Hydrotalea sp. AMD]RWZ87281.1 MAG: hypothetical protein EO766_12210 [Hydrotalea sp. AMD]
MTTQPNIEVWLDLEETIIDDWDNGLLVNHGKIKRWLDNRNITELRIWSFAIHNDADKKVFDFHMKEIIERVLDRPIIEVLSVEEMCQKISKTEKTHYDDISDFIQMNGKMWSFIKFCLGHKQNKHLVLIDDCVPNMRIDEFDKKLIIELVKVQTL